MPDLHRLDYQPPSEEEAIQDIKLSYGISPVTTACLVLSATFIALPLTGLFSIGIGITRLKLTPQRNRRERVAAAICVALGGVNLAVTMMWFRS